MADILGSISKALGFGGRKNVAPTVTAGASGEDISGTGYVVSQERSPKLRGRRRYATYNELVTNTLIVAASVRYFLNLIANAEWVPEPPKDEDGEPIPGSQEVADFVKEVMDDMETPWSRVIRRAAMFSFNGFSIQEWTAKKRDDGRIGMKDVEPRPCSTIERWDTDEGGSVRGVIQQIDSRPEVYLPRGKIIYLVDDALEVSVEGTGLLRHLTRATERLRAFEELEELAFETDLRGIPIGRAPLGEMRKAVAAGTMTAEAVKKARAAVDSFVKNKIINRSKGLTLDSETYNGTDANGGVSPSAVRKFDVELLQGDASGQAEVAAAIQRLNREIATLLGTEHLLLGSDGTGSLALGWTKLSSFFLVVMSTLRQIGEGYDRDFVGPTCSLNGIDKKLWPKLTPQDIDVADIEAVAAALQSLATAGAPLQPGDPAVDNIRARMGLPPAPEYDPALDPANMALIGQIDPVTGKPLSGPANKPKAGPDEDIKPGSEGAAAQRQKGNQQK